MEILSFDKANKEYRKQAAALLVESFPHAYKDRAGEEMDAILEEGRVTLMAVENGCVIGFAGAVPQYGVTGWELHPLVVKRSEQFKGTGSALLAALEKEVAARGCLTLYLGSDDEFGQTTLSGTDLFENPFEKIQRIQNLKRHPYEFYRKNGYAIVGVIPDANGPGKPDIWMAKRVAKRPGEIFFPV